jgi:hypothetical protein
MDAAARQLVRQRARQRCEYCRFPDHALNLPFHVEHVIASVHRIDDSIANLAWACPRCNLKKGTNLSTVVVETGEHVDLFNPRTMNWSDHFIVQNGFIIGITACGIGTARLLDMNNELRLNHRRVLIEQGEFDVA